MKILTLNAHSLLEANYQRKLAQFVEFVLREQPDLIALQEVNQSIGAAEIDPAMLEGLVPAPGVSVPVRSDNHAAWTAYLLRESGVPVSWTWLPVKIGYGCYDEGLALMSLSGTIAETDSIHLSRRTDYADWRVRKALGARIGSEWFYTVHMGWWSDPEEPFQHQWSALQSGVRRSEGGNVWLLGDFNSPAEVRGEGYDQIRADGWQDAWLLAGERRGEATVEGAIDGWRDRVENPDELTGMRIDHIWCRQPEHIRRARVIFDGRHEPKVSDHYGILMETKGETA